MRTRFLVIVVRRPPSLIQSLGRGSFLLHTSNPIRHLAIRVQGLPDNGGKQAEQHRGRHEHGRGDVYLGCKEGFELN